MKRLWLFVFFQGIVFLLAAQKKDSLPPAVYRFTELTRVSDSSRTRMQVMEGGTSSLANLEVHVTTLAPGKAPHPPHLHEDMEELVIVKEGLVKAGIGDNSQVLGPGSIAFAMPGDMHGFTNAGNSPATYYVFKYKGKWPDHTRVKEAGGSFMLNWNNLPVKSIGKGYRRDFFNRATSQLAQFEMHTTALNADSVSHAPHTHVQEEILIILRGKVTIHINGKLIPASPGDLVFLPAMIPHALLNTGKEQCEYFAFQWRN